MAFPSFSPSPQQQQPLFQSPYPFQQQQPQPQQLLQIQQQQQLQLLQNQQQQQQHQQQQVHYLFTTEKAPASYQTKWSELHPDSQNILLKIEERILEYRDESQRLDQCARLFDTSVSSDSFELDANCVMQELGGISTALEREKLTLQGLMSVSKVLIRNAEVAVRSFMMLQPRFVHPGASATSTSTSVQTQGSAIIPSTGLQPKPSSVLPVLEFYSGYPKRPSAFLQQTVLQFEKRIAECRQWIEELEHLLLEDTNVGRISGSDTLLNSLPMVMSNVHDFFVHVAAKVETLHQHVESMRDAYLADQRLRGDGNDPFLEADRRETAKREADARRVHPTLHVPALPQPSTQAAGLFSSSVTSSQASILPRPSGSPAASSSTGFSIFSTPSTSATSGSSLSSFSFSTPSLPAPTSTTFGTSGSPQQASLFGTPSASSLFATPQTHSLFGTSTSFGATPAAGSSPFSATPSFGAATGSGASFGAGTRTSKSKTRTGRR